MEQNITFNCHYISQFHLNFFCNSEGKIYEYILNKKCWASHQGKNNNQAITTNAIAKTKGLYVYYNHEKKSYDDSIEKSFSLFETKWSKLLKKINDNEKLFNIDEILNNEEYNDWIDFISFSKIRTNKYFNEIKNIIKNKKLTIDKYHHKKRNINYDINVSHKEVLLHIFPNHNLKKSEAFLSNHKKFSLMKYMIINTNKNISFPIGDSCICERDDFYILPLTHKKIILISINPEKTLKTLKKQHNQNLTSFFIKVIIDNCSKSLFCSNQEPYIKELSNEVFLNCNYSEQYKIDYDNDKILINKTPQYNEMFINSFLLNDFKNFIDNKLLKLQIARPFYLSPFVYCKTLIKAETIMEDIILEKTKYDFFDDCYFMFFIIPANRLEKIKNTLLNNKNKIKRNEFIDLLICWDSLKTESLLVCYITKKINKKIQRCLLNLVKKYSFDLVSDFSIIDENFLLNNKVYNFLSFDKNIFM